jgi:hypothetical protein
VSAPRWRLQITADGVPGDTEAFGFDDAVAVIGAAMGLALAQGQKLSVALEPVAAVAELSPRGRR